MDRLTSLTVFGRVVECGGFSAAARRLNMSVTMVSNHIQSLEERLGARLLNRTTRKVSLTEIGRTYYERSSQILADLDDADRVASALHATPRGTLKLYASINHIRFLTPIISEYLKLYPAAAIDFVVGERMVDVIEDGYDLVIRAVPPPESGLIVRRLTPWRHTLCCAPSYLESHPALESPADLAHHNCLRYAFYPFGNDWRFEGPDDKPTSVRVGGNFVTGSADALRIVALDGQGIFLAPSFTVVDDLSTGALVQLMPDHRPVEFVINAIYPSKHNLSAKVRAFIDLLVERFTAYRAWMDPSASSRGIAKT